MKHLLVTLMLYCLTFGDDTQVLKDFQLGYNAFTSNVYKELIKGNSYTFIVCPLSVDTVLALVNVGAEGKTSQELSTTLGLPENPEEVEKMFRTISPSLQGSDKYKLSSANKVYVNYNYHISDKFRKVAEDVFHAEIQNIDFNLNQYAADEINHWVEDKTDDKIKNLLFSSMMDRKTSAVLVNALYFQANWSHQFDAINNYDLPFHINKTHSVTTKMMSERSSYAYYECKELNAKFLRLDYEGGDVSMHIVLPNDIEGLGAIEEKIQNVLVPPEYQDEYVMVSIPKFKIETKIRFVPILKELGVKAAFEDSAQFPNLLDEPEDLKISEVVQKAFIEVEEKGTTAAAATAVLVAQIESAFLGPEPKRFVADHPFVFYLRLNKPGINFFIGRYTFPKYY